MSRTAHIHRVTGETDVSLSLGLDGAGGVVRGVLRKGMRRWEIEVASVDSIPAHLHLMISASQELDVSVRPETADVAGPMAREPGRAST